MARLFAATFLLCAFLLPGSALAQRRDYSEYWKLQQEGRNIVAIIDSIESLKLELAEADRLIEQAKETYTKVLEGIQYERATLAREREAAEAADSAMQMEARDIMGRMALVGPPKHVKRWSLQRGLQNALVIFDKDRLAAFEDLERREELLAREAAKAEHAHRTALQRLERRKALLAGALEAEHANLTFATTDRKTVFLQDITVPEKEGFLAKRKAEYASAQQRRAERLRMAVMQGKLTGYLLREQPEVRASLEAELVAEEDERQKLFEKQLIESLRSNLSAEELKRLHLELYLLPQQ